MKAGDDGALEGRPKRPRRRVLGTYRGKDVVKEAFRNLDRKPRQLCTGIQSLWISFSPSCELLT